MVWDVVKGSCEQALDNCRPQKEQKQKEKLLGDHKVMVPERQFYLRVVLL